MGILVSEVVEKIEEDIVFGQRHPRERLVEDDLLVQFNAKKHVIREALTSLERMGLVEKPKNKGAQVRDYTPEDVKQIFSVRKLLEAEAARQIPLPADSIFLKSIKKVKSDHLKAVNRSDFRSAFRLNIEFYHILFGACGNSFLAEVIKDLKLKSLGIKFFSFANPELLKKSKKYHEIIIQAIDQNDRNTLVEICSKLLEPCMEAYLAEHQNFLARENETTFKRLEGLPVSS